MEVFPDPSYLLDSLALRFPLIGIYDAPSNTAFPSLVEPPIQKRQCIYAFFDQWIEGKTSRLTAERFGCGGCGRAWFGVQPRTRDDYIHFLTCTEGLKENAQLMEEWIDHFPPYRPEHDALFVGLLYREFFSYLKSVLFFVQPDQLSLLTIGAQYHARLQDPEPVIAPFGSGCMQSLVVFRDLSIPQAAIGALDLAMRPFIPQDTLILSVTVPMFQRLCQLNSRSFLGKGFLKTLRKSRQTGELA